MDNLFNELMESIFIKSGLSLAKIEYIEESYEISTSLYIAHKPNSDYFIYLYLPEKALPFVANDIQINLLSILKNDVGSMNVLSGESVTISSSFEKNATLIILTSKEEYSQNNVEKQAISIEEDPYFFKKQILVVPPQYLEVISNSFSKHRQDYTTYLENLISDPQVFNEFMNSSLLGMSNKAIEYSFAAKLYEKLPFLVLSVEKSTPGDLQKNIDSSLTESQRKQCEVLLKLEVDNLSNWFAEIVKEDNDV
ncbi:ABC-three component system middle component 1 [Shewanella scandinavica]|uniref:ABC-three component system middle component 1 n=1 Tax=Shewanella scandinavica TaxID=3063538 RepID=UPI0030282FC2